MLCAALLSFSAIPIPVMAVEETPEEMSEEEDAPILLTSVYPIGISGLDDAKEMNAGAFEDFTVVLDTDTSDGEVTWESSVPTIATVVPNVTDGKKATVTALAAGETTITASAEQEDGTKVSDTCVVTVKSDPTAVAVSLADALDASNILTTQGTFRLNAELTPAAEYCTDSTVTWSVTAGEDYVTLSADGEVTIGELPTNLDEVSVTFQAETFNRLTNSITVTIKKAVPTVEVNDLTLTYGDESQTLTASVNGTANAAVTFTQMDGTDVATVGTDGTVTPRQAGTFKVKASFAGDVTYKAAESPEKELTVQKKTLQVVLTDSTTPVTKESDGTNVLTDTNKADIQSRVKIADGQVVVGDTVNLTVDIPDTVVYTKTSLLSGNTVSLGNLAIAMETPDSNYVLDTSAVTSADLPASITPIAPGENSADMTSVSVDVNLDGRGVTFQAGKEGRSGGYWYDADGVGVTLPAGTTLVKASGDAAADGAYLTAASGEEFYINQSEIYYGPYTLIYQNDSTAPNITLVSVQVDGTEVEGVVFDKTVIYTIQVNDVESGVKAPGQNGILYGIAPENNVGTVSVWQEPASLTEDGNTYTFQVEVEGNGYLFVKAVDCAENTGLSDGIRAVVLESTAPSITVSEDNADYEQKHTIQIETKDADAEGTSPYTYSGIAKIVYELRQGSELVYTSTTSNPYVPASLDDLPAARTLNDSIVDIQTGNCGIYDGQMLDGEYTLTATVYDNCGNSKSADCTLNFDNTTPEYSITMSGGQTDAVGKFYYRADNCGLTVEVSDRRAEDGLDYVINVGTVQKTGTLNANGDISFTPEDLANLSDGSIPVTVQVTDAAGNTNTKYAEVNGITGLNGTEDRTEASFVLDKTAPVVTSITTSGTAKGSYDSDDYYYNEAGLTVTFDIAEDNAAEDQWTASVKKDGTADNCFTVTSSQVQFDLSADGKYTEFTVSGQDLAGNPLKLGEGLALSDAAADEVQAAGTTPGQNGIVTMQKNKVIDHVAPVAVITYTTAETDHMYTDASGYTAAAYYNTDVTAEVTVTDQYGATPVSLDASKLYFGDTGTYAAAGSDSADTTASITYTWDQDGRYYAEVYGTDRAGNPVTVKEQIPDMVDQFVTTEAQGEGYSAKYLLIRDTKAPEYKLDIQSPSSSMPSKNAQGNRYYFNKTFTAETTIEEDNFEPNRIYIQRVSMTASDHVNSQTAELAEGFSGNVTGSDRVYTDTVTAGDGIYRYRIYGTDRAGNALVPSSDSLNPMNLTTEKQTLKDADFIDAEQKDEEAEADLSVHVVLDTVRPVIDVNVTEDRDGGETFYTAQLTSAEAYEIRKNLPYRSVSKAKAAIKGTDFSPIQLIYSFETSNTSASNVNGNYRGSGYVKNDSRTSIFNGQQTVRITGLKATDLAGNSSTAEMAYDGAVSTWMYLDVEPPVYDELAPTVTMKLSGNTDGKAKGSIYGPDGNELYTSDVIAEVLVEDPNKTIKSSGLYKVYYKAEVNGEDWTDKGLVEVSSSTDSGVITSKTKGVLYYGTAGAGSSVTENETLTYKDHLKFRFSTSDFNYNDVKLTVWAEDNSGNVIAESSRIARGFGIDLTKPMIKVSYDNNDVKNDRYFNGDRTATIEVTERNFDENNTPIDTQDAAKVSGWSHTSGNAANGDEDIWTCTVSWQVDGDYTFDVKTTDLAGNSMDGNVDYGNSVVPTDFTIDKTVPVINITFDNEDVRNGKYFNASRKASVEIQEHNFSGDGAVIAVTADIAEGTVAAPGITGWTSGNDRNVTSVPFTADGDYTMQVAYTDLAGNVAEMKTVEEFTVDTTAPVIEIGGVEENSANQGEVSPSITYHDINYDASMTAVSIQGYKNRDGKNLNGSAQENAFGGSFVCTNIEEIPENDDVYLCTGHVEDMAGNSSEAELRFSVNRFGSNYILDEATEALVENYYTNASPAIQITEINVNSLEFQEITATLNGEIINLEEGRDYQVVENGDENTWKEYRYTIPADYFQEDGAYNITVHSRDTAKNENSNRTAQIAEYSKPIDFVLDMTNPEVVISGVENDAQYMEDSRIITLLAEDNIQLQELQLYLDGEMIASYDEEALSQAAGTITYQAESKNDWQTFKVIVKDKAGNRAEHEVRFLLTSNLWIQYTHHAPLVVGTVAGVSGIGLLLALWRRMQKMYLT